MKKEDYSRLFNLCFQDKKDSYYIRYIRILQSPSSYILSGNLQIGKRNAYEKDLIQNKGYEKWKIIPLKFFQMNNIPTELSDDYENNIVFLTPLNYFYSSYYLQEYFNNRNDILCRFFKDRLYNILKRKANTENIPEQIKGLIYYKIRKGIKLTKEDDENIKELFLNHYRGRRKERRRNKNNDEDKKNESP